MLDSDFSRNPCFVRNLNDRAMSKLEIFSSSLILLLGTILGSLFSSFSSILRRAKFLVDISFKVVVVVFFFFGRGGIKGDGL